MAIEQLMELKDFFEPHYDNLDHIVDDLIHPKISTQRFKYFDACRFKMKAIYYIQSKVQTLDTSYRELLSLCIVQNTLDKLSLTEDKDCYFYFPFYEALEFENLLSQGKACLDSFSKALGSIYNENPNNIDRLINMLKAKPSDPKVDRALDFINETDRLHGLIVDPKIEKKKSLRDLISHREKIDISFRIRLDHDTEKYILSDGALLNMKHPEISRFPNYRVTEICDKIWILLQGIIENCFKIYFNDYA